MKNDFPVILTNASRPSKQQFCCRIMLHTKTIQEKVNTQTLPHMLTEGVSYQILVQFAYNPVTMIQA
jgi:hypothetical protein